VRKKTTPGQLPLSEPFEDLLRPGFPAKRDESLVLDRPLTEEHIAASHNNFYELTTDKQAVWQLVGSFRPRPWTIRVVGAVEKPLTIDVEDHVRLGLTERLYRFRCVEAWAMAVPWTGVPLRRFLEHVRPLSSAKYVRFVSFLRKAEAPGQALQPWYPWPYYEGLTIQEATHDLALLATGIYGHALPRQHGAPVRLIVPWKYGFKSIKSIEVVELLDKQPPTFWNDLQPDEYDFNANVAPKVPHPRWSQAQEKMIGTDEIKDTVWLNGYAALVASLYGNEPSVPGWQRARPPFRT
jgi:sulfoxide reductase catalytic subunit YedY